MNLMDRNRTYIEVFFIFISIFCLVTCTTCNPQVNSNFIHYNVTRLYIKHVVILFRRFQIFIVQWHHEEKYPSPGDWLNHGGNKYNRRYAEGETKISPSTAPKLRLKWEFYAGDDVSATPAIYKGTVYFPSWNGYLYAVKASDGSLVWKKNLQKLTGLKSTLPTILNLTSVALLSRATPSIADDDMLIVGIYGPAYVIAVERATGKIIWKKKVDSHPYAVITMSGTYYNK